MRSEWHRSFGESTHCVYLQPFLSLQCLKAVTSTVLRLLRCVNLNFYHLCSYICKPGWFWLRALGLVPQVPVPADPHGLRRCTAEVLPAAPLLVKLKLNQESGISLGSVCCLKSNPLQCCSLVRGQLSGVGAALGLSPSAPRCAGFCYPQPGLCSCHKGADGSNCGDTTEPRLS